MYCWATGFSAENILSNSRDLLICPGLLWSQWGMKSGMVLQGIWNSLLQAKVHSQLLTGNWHQTCIHWISSLIRNLSWLRTWKRERRSRGGGKRSERKILVESHTDWYIGAKPQKEGQVGVLGLSQSFFGVFLFQMDGKQVLKKCGDLAISTYGYILSNFNKSISK